MSNKWQGSAALFGVLLLTSVVTHASAREWVYFSGGHGGTQIDRHGSFPDGRQIFVEWNFSGMYISEVEQMNGTGDIVEMKGNGDGEKQIHPVTRNLRDIIGACAQGHYITLDELYAYCKIPGICYQEMACEQKMVLLKGYVSYVNIWNKEEYPWIPHSKFILYNEVRTLNIEVRVDSADADNIFNKIKVHSVHPDDPVYMKGKLVGVDLPDMKTCHRDLVVVLSGAESIFFMRRMHQERGSHRGGM